MSENEFNIILNRMKEDNLTINKQKLKNDLTTIIYENIDKSVSIGKLLL